MRNCAIVRKLAVERLRWTTPTTESENRLSRMCMADAETPEHVLFRRIGTKQCRRMGTR